ncbi:hypothetical protein [Zunongwangia sp.]|uniref:hypothetical protein n=1 Tax=Zunongwangia sp. TaxID=1965325 RepID=UPI003AA82DB3
MKQISTVLVVFLITLVNPLLAQKSFDIPNSKITERFIENLPNKLGALNLKDLRTSLNSITIRIWKNNEVFTINHNDSTFLDYKLYIKNNELLVRSFKFSEAISQPLLNKLIDAKITDLENDNFRGIDGSFIYIETSTKKKYKIVSFWSPSSERSADNKTLIQILKMLNQAIDSKHLKHHYLNSLSPGNYTWGTSTIRIDSFLDEKIHKTNFYNKAETKIRNKLKITDSTKHWEYPVVFINNSIAKISNLNLYNNEDVTKFKIIPPDMGSVLYGNMGRNGVIVVDAK